MSAAQLTIPFGRRGDYLHELARGIDCTPVLPAGKKPPMVVHDHRFAGGSNDVAQAEKALFLLTEKAGRQLRRQGLATGKIAVTLSYSDGDGLARQAKMKTPSADGIAIFTLARHLLQMARRRRIRLAGLRLACHRRRPNSNYSADSHTTNQRCCSRLSTPSVSGSEMTVSDGEGREIFDW